jgi:hypothetical protein
VDGRIHAAGDPTVRGRLALQLTRDGIAPHQTRLALLVRCAQRLGLLEPGLVTERPLTVAKEREFVAGLYAAAPQIVVQA